MAPIVIVGTGMAGYALARELRRLDKSSEIVMLTNDAGEAYAKPMLSNAIASAKEVKQLVTAQATKMAEDLGVRIFTHRPVHDIDRAQKELDTARGALRYRSLVLALGADPLRPPMAGDAAVEVLPVNDIDAYRTLRRRLSDAGPNARVVILGAGLVGCELADDLLAGGCQVTLVDPNARPLATLAAPALSAALVQAWAGRQLTLRMHEKAVAVHRTRPGYVLELSSGARIEADLVISAAGLRPSTDLARRAGLATATGILVDAYGRTSDPDIHALGDCAEYEIDGDRAVLPYVAPMLNAARALASTLAGIPVPIVHKNEPVIVKTPSRRLALFPPARGMAGEWRTVTADGRVIARFVDREGKVRGFGLTEPTAALRQVLLAELGTALP
jgi:rubredoxin-NAD+ reductase